MVLERLQVVRSLVVLLVRESSERQKIVENDTFQSHDDPLEAIGRDQGRLLQVTVQVVSKDADALQLYVQVSYYQVEEVAVCQWS